MSYEYLVTRVMGDKIAIVKKGVSVGESGKKKTAKTDARLQGINLMMKRLFAGKTNQQLQDETGLTPAQLANRMAHARKDGVEQIARDMFITEFLPEAMVVLQEALRGENLKLATQVALKVVAGLEIMEDPIKKEQSAMEPESLEAWRVKFTKKVAPIEGVVVKQLARTNDAYEDLSESSGTESEPD